MSILISFLCLLLAGFLLTVPTVRRLPNSLLAVFLLLTAMSYCAGDDDGNAARDDTPESAAASGLPASIAPTLQSNVMQLRNAVRSAASIRITNCVRALLAHPPVTATSSA